MLLPRMLATRTDWEGSMGVADSDEAASRVCSVNERDLAIVSTHPCVALGSNHSEVAQANGLTLSRHLWHTLQCAKEMRVSMLTDFPPCLG